MLCIEALSTLRLVQNLIDGVLCSLREDKEPIVLCEEGEERARRVGHAWLAHTIRQLDRSIREQVGGRRQLEGHRAERRPRVRAWDREDHLVGRA